MNIFCRVEAAVKGGDNKIYQVNSVQYADEDEHDPNSSHIVLYFQ
jgi:hypothetical protein